MAKSFSEQITEALEKQNKEIFRLREYEKLFEKLFEKSLKLKFGLSKKDIEKLIQNQEKYDQSFERKICSYFALNSDADKEDFLTLLCSVSGADFFRRNRMNSAGENSHPQQG